MPEKLKVLDLFSGIGGFSLGLERTGGFETVAFCEIDPFCRKVLNKHWPGIPIFQDIKLLNKEDVDKIDRIDVICGGFPCQPVSCAGKRKGKEDERWLWPEFYRIVCEVRPRWVVIENVPGLLSIDSGKLFAEILRDLSKGGYDAEWNIVSAAFVGAPHLRKRVFIVAHTDRGRLSEQGVCQELARRAKAICTSEDVAHTNGLPSQSLFGDLGREQTLVEAEQGEQEPGSSGETSREATHTSGERLSQPQQEREYVRPIAECGWWAVEPSVGRVANGVRDRVDRLRALGNAIVPQCSEYVGRCILDSLEVA